MTRKEIYRQYLHELRQIYDAGEVAVITDWVFEKEAHLLRSDIIKNPDHPIASGILKNLSHCLTALLQQKPVQYVLGEAWFYKMKLKVNEYVLIPRPETEELVQLIAEQWRSAGNQNEPVSMQEPTVVGNKLMIDIGTGSGCIAIAVKKELPGAKIYAIDISEKALAIAKENADHQKTAIKFQQLDFLDENSWHQLPLFDVIISNPPYIPMSEISTLARNVTAFEPHSALFVPDDEPMLFYKKIAGFAKRHLQLQGKIYVEIHEDFASLTAAVFEQFFWVEIKKDMFGKERMLIASNKSLHI